MSHIETLEQAERAGEERLHPSLTNPNWLILRKRRDLFVHWLRAIPGESLSVLDVGGRIAPYRSLLDGRCAQYRAIDLRITPLVDVVGRAEQLPFADGQFDLVFCTQVLEYTPDPKAVIQQVHRALRPGGFLLLSVPAVFPRDSDIEYWRFLPDALRYLLSDFSRVEMAPEGDSLIGFLRTVNVCLVTFIKPAGLRLVLRWTLVPLINIFGTFLQYLIPTADDRFTANFSVLAQK